MSEHYFSADPTSAYRVQPVAMTVWGHDLVMDTASGVFARGRLDAGTAVLLRETSPPTDGDVLLDLGCGWGVLAVALALARPSAVVWAVDVNERALALTRANAERHEVGDRVRAVTPEQVPDDVRPDQVWSNPPIRIGKPQLHAMLRRWLGRLADEGTATMVVSRNLGADSLQRWLTEQGWPTTRVASVKGFRVLHASAG